MINYSDDDWKLLDDDNLSSGEVYFVHDGHRSLTLGLMDYDGYELSNEAETIYPDELIAGHKIYVMPFEFPSPPRALDEKAANF